MRGRKIRGFYTDDKKRVRPITTPSFTPRRVQNSQQRSIQNILDTKIANAVNSDVTCGPDLAEKLYNTQDVYDYFFDAYRRDRIKMAEENIKEKKRELMEELKKGPISEKDRRLYFDDYIEYWENEKRNISHMKQLFDSQVWADVKRAIDSDEYPDVVVNWYEKPWEPEVRESMKAFISSPTAFFITISELFDEFKSGKYTAKTWKEFYLGTIPIYRGISGEYKPGKPSPLESWSLDKREAEAFARYPYRYMTFPFSTAFKEQLEEKPGVVIKAEVPVRDIIWYRQTREKEVLLKPGSAKIIAIEKVEPKQAKIKAN